MDVDEGVDFIHVSATMTREGMKEMFNGAFIQLASAIKKAVDVPIICVGAVKTIDRAEEILVQRDADLVALGRALVADPGLFTKTLNDQEAEIVECLNCWKCGRSIGDDDGNGMKCAQNPDLP